MKKTKNKNKKIKKKTKKELKSDNHSILRIQIIKTELNSVTINLLKNVSGRMNEQTIEQDSYTSSRCFLSPYCNFKLRE